MSGDRWIEITNYEREMYDKALVWIKSYNSAAKRTSIETALLVGSSGAVTGAMINKTIGGIGIAAGGKAFGVRLLGLATMGTIAGLAAYGISKALD